MPPRTVVTERKPDAATGRQHHQQTVTQRIAGTGGRYLRPEFLLYAGKTAVTVLQRWLNFTTDPQRAAEMTALSRNVLKTLKTNGVSDNALKEARANWLLEKQQVYQSAAFWTESLAQIAGTIMSLHG